MAQYEGYNGQIDIDDEAITISREGFKARAVFGKVAPRRIPLAALGGIRVKQPTRLVNGWVQLFLGTANKAEPGDNAPSDPDTVLFTHAKRLVLTDLAEALSAIVSANQQEGVDPSSVEFEEGSSRSSRLEAKQASLAEKRDALAGKAGLPTTSERGGRVDSFAGVTLYAKWIDAGRDGSGPVAGAHATVDTAGAIDRRLSATRVVMTGGLGLFWKKKVDKRELYLLIEGQGFAIVKDIDPDKGKQARSFATMINQTAARAAPPDSVPAPVTSPPAAPSADDPVDAIRKLAALRDEGLLTEEEFTAKKAQILGL